MYGGGFHKCMEEGSISVWRTGSIHCNEVDPVYLEEDGAAVLLTF